MSRQRARSSRRRRKIKKSVKTRTKSRIKSIIRSNISGGGPGDVKTLLRGIRGIKKLFHKNH